MAPADPRLIDSFQFFSKWAAVGVIIVAYHVWIGWMFDVAILKGGWPGSVAMKPNTAVGLALAGVALYMMQAARGNKFRQARVVAQVSAGITAFIGGITFCEYLFHWNLGIDQWIFHGQAGAAGTMSPGKMASTSALALFFAGTALVLLDRQTVRRRRPAEFLALGMAIISLLAIVGHVYGAALFFGLASHTHMGLLTASALFVLALAILCARPDRGLMAKITSDSFGGLVARRLLPATAVIPFILGLLGRAGQRAGWYDAAFGVALFASMTIVVFTLVVWWSVNSLHRLDTKRRQTEAELRETAAKLARSNADLEQFAYVASHDLQEPLRAVSGCVQILQERYQGQLNGDANEIIQHTVDGATRMQTLIKDLLTYSRLTTREAPLTATDCSAIVRDVLANLETAIRESHAVVTCDPLPTVKADRIQLLQVFQNLLSNALKYRSERTPKIHIGAEEKENEWILSVRDNGIGIAPQYVGRIFRLFQRLHTRGEYSGTGIGLAICKKIVERHGGRIWLESEPEEGSTFFFTLPSA